jgi:predicted nucleic acid-binding protein
MSDEKPKSEVVEDEELSEAELAQLESPAFSQLLKRSLTKTEDVLPEPAKDAELLASVQKKLRKRSKGKFYGDGWSTSQSRLNYALIAAVMLVTIVAVWLALGPTGFSLR